MKLNIEDFTQLGLISLDDIGIQGRVYYWCNGEYHLFDNVNSSDSITSVEPASNEGIGLSYYFGNSSVSEDKTIHEVDLMLRASLNSLFVNGEVLINYNELAFGSNILLNSNLEFIPSNSFIDNSNYSIEIEDYDSNSFLLRIASEHSDDPSLLIDLSENSTKIGKLIMEIEDCNESIGLSLSKPQADTKQVHFTGNYPIPFENYSPVNLSSENNSNSCECEPKVTSFFPETIPAGTGDILTIVGEDFGDFNFATSVVTFNDGDGIGSDRMTSGPADIVSWVDDEIQIKVPSTDRNNTFMRMPAASGKIAVGNSCGLSDDSEETLIIPYAIFNLRPSIAATPIKATVATNDSESMCFYYSDKVPDWVKIQFEIALNDWCIETSVNFSIAGITGNNDSKVDKENVISFLQPDGAGLGATTNISFSYYSNNFCTEDESGVMFKELDMQIISGLSNPSIQDESEMRERIKHEIGHMLMLNHSRSGNTEFQHLMHPEGNAFGDIKSQDSEGANLVFANSQAIVAPSCGFPLGSGSCNADCSPNSVSEVYKVSNSLETFPNPTTKTTTVLIKNGFEGILEVRDVNGCLYSSIEITGKEQTVDVILPEAQGVYIVELKNSINSIFAKVVKL